MCAFDHLQQIKCIQSEAIPLCNLCILYIRHPVRNCTSFSSNISNLMNSFFVCGSLDAFLFVIIKVWQDEYIVEF